jgi:hypothetical protein
MAVLNPTIQVAMFTFSRLNRCRSNTPGANSGGSPDNSSLYPLNINSLGTATKATVVNFDAVKPPGFNQLHTKTTLQVNGNTSNNITDGGVPPKKTGRGSVPK